MFKSTILVSFMALLLFSTTAVAVGPWYFGYENLGTDKATQEGWIPEYATSEVWESEADNAYSMFWDVKTHSTAGPQLTGFSFSNEIGTWLSLPEGHEDKAIKYTVKNDFSDIGGWNNTDIIEFREDETEEMIKHGALLDGVIDTLGIENKWDDTGGYDRDMTALDLNGDEDPGNKYAAIGKVGEFNADGSLVRGYRNWQVVTRGTWGSEEGSGYAAPGTQGILDIAGTYSGEKIALAYSPGPPNLRFETYYKDSGDGNGNRWFGRVEIQGGTYPQYDLYLEDTDGSIKAYDASKFPEDSANPGDEDAASGYPIRWHDDADAMLTSYTGVATLGVSGRWIVERPEWFYWNMGQARFHEADVLTSLTDDTEIYFEHAWEIAGTMLGKKFWESGYVWSNELGAVATRSYATGLYQLLGNIYLPTMINTGGGVWDFPGAVNPTAKSTWGFLDVATDTAVAGYDDINYFIKYVMDIDALVVEDVDGDGRFDEGEDYILFSLVDDSMYTGMTPWWGGAGTVDTSGLAGQYFSGETVFLYDGDTVQTWFDPWNGTRAIFFGQSVTTNPGTLLGGAFGWYELNSLDIGLTTTCVIPEPATIMLIVGAGIALGAGILRRKVR